MKYLTLFVPLFLAWAVCVNADPPSCTGQPPSYCPDDYCQNGGSCEVENGKATCHCLPNYKGRCCDQDSSGDRPMSSVPANYEAVDEEARGLIYQKKCTALDNLNRNPPGCGFGYAVQLFRYSGDIWVVYIYVKVVCCCWPCHGGNGPPPPPPPYRCVEVFPALNDPTYWTPDSWMCAPPPDHPNAP